MRKATDDSEFWLHDQGFDLTPIRRRYLAPYRVYHGIDHIEHMLQAVDSMVHYYGMEADGRVILHLATWYHDAIYVVGAKDNEERSADLARTEISRQRNAGFASVIAQKVMVTKTHRLPWHATLTDAIIVDADLAGLGADSEVYTANSQKVKDEFNVNDELWFQGRTAFLENFLARPNIYYTAWGAEREKKARMNMAGELAYIKAKTK
jgi:predicted metal-dependent HD superfamily phosphohydrolase